MRLSKFKIFGSHLTCQGRLQSADFQRRIAAGKFSFRPRLHRCRSLTAERLQGQRRLTAAGRAKDRLRHDSRHHVGNRVLHVGQPLADELKRWRWTALDLAQRRKGDAQKLRIARRLRQETTMTLNWMAKRLNMGAAGSLANRLRDAERK